MKLFVSYTFGCEGGTGNGNASLTVDGPSRMPSFKDVQRMQEVALEMIREDVPTAKNLAINWWAELREDD